MIAAALDSAAHGHAEPGMDHRRTMFEATAGCGMFDLEVL
jgi:hypothetical protein